MKRIIIVAFAAVALGWGLHFWNERTVASVQQKAGTIVILNGPSAAGKTTLQKELQKTLNELYLTVGIDGFFDAVLPHDFPNGQSIVGREFVRGVSTSIDAEGHQIITLNIGQAGRRVVTGMHNAFAAYAAAGNNLIIDYILYEKEWLPELMNALKDYKVYFIGVTIPLELLEERERARGTSPVGHARSHYDTVHAHGEYDLEVDTSKMSSQEAARTIKQFMLDNPEPQTFKKLSEKDSFSCLYNQDTKKPASMLPMPVMKRIL